MGPILYQKLKKKKKKILAGFTVRNKIRKKLKYQRFRGC